MDLYCRYCSRGEHGYRIALEECNGEIGVFWRCPRCYSVFISREDDRAAPLITRPMIFYSRGLLNRYTIEYLKFVKFGKRRHPTKKERRKYRKRLRDAKLPLMRRFEMENRLLGRNTREAVAKSAR